MCGGVTRGGVGVCVFVTGLLRVVWVSVSVAGLLGVSVCLWRGYSGWCGCLCVCGGVTQGGVGVCVCVCGWVTQGGVGVCVCVCGWVTQGGVGVCVFVAGLLGVVWVSVCLWLGYSGWCGCLCVCGGVTRGGVGVCVFVTVFPGFRIISDWHVVVSEPENTSDAAGSRCNRLKCSPSMLLNGLHLSRNKHVRVYLLFECTINMQGDILSGVTLNPCIPGYSWWCQYLHMHNDLPDSHMTQKIPDFIWYFDTSKKVTFISVGSPTNIISAWASRLT